MFAETLRASMLLWHATQLHNLEICDLCRSSPMQASATYV